MNKGKLTTYVLSLLLLAILLSCFLLVKANNPVYLVVITIVFALLILWLVNGRSVLSINKGQVLIILSVSALLFVMLYFMTGLYFGYYRSPYIGFSSVFRKIAPFVVVVVCTELIRSRLAIQNSVWIRIIAVLSCVIAEVTLSYNYHSFNNFNKFMDFVGLSLFPAIVTNILFSYLIVRYGALPNIAYRVITLVLPYCIPYVPAISGALYSLIKLLFPIIIYLFVNLLYEKKQREKKRVSKKVSALLTSVLLVCFSGLIMLISCQFHFCAIVIATESMTGEINKGDVIVYEKYTPSKDVIVKGQVIVFDKDGARTVHRVVEIENVNGQARYYTKGDANDSNDSGYITDSDIYGFVHFKISYVGYPTLLLREIFR